MLTPGPLVGEDPDEPVRRRRAGAGRAEPREQVVEAVSTVLSVKGHDEQVGAFQLLEHVLPVGPRRDCVALADR
jgi:hypothetical protein